MFSWKVSSQTLSSCFNLTSWPRPPSCRCSLILCPAMSHRWWDIAVWAPLSLSVALAMIDHHTPLCSLYVAYDFECPVLQCFQLYFTGLTQAVHRGAQILATTSAYCSIPHGSVLRPILIIYAPDLTRQNEYHGLCPHLYAGDHHLQTAAHPLRCAI
jgi:hypothetical protein